MKFKLCNKTVTTDEEKIISFKSSVFGGYFMVEFEHRISYAERWFIEYDVFNGKDLDIAATNESHIKLYQKNRTSN